MVAGMLPMALALQGSSSARSPIAVGVIGGLITSTALSLLVVPVVFELIDEFKVRLHHFLPFLQKMHVAKAVPNSSAQPDHDAATNLGDRVASKT